jgi:hypothetical protein
MVGILVAKTLLKMGVGNMTWLDLKNAKSKEIAKELDPLYKYANCVDCPTEWFFPLEKRGGKYKAEPGSSLFNAFTTCNECKVKDECFNFAKKHGCVGVWGGKLFIGGKVSKAKIGR